MCSPMTLLSHQECAGCFHCYAQVCASSNRDSWIASGSRQIQVISNVIRIWAAAPCCRRLDHRGLGMCARGSSSAGPCVPRSLGHALCCRGLGSEERTPVYDTEERTRECIQSYLWCWHTRELEVETILVNPPYRGEIYAYTCGRLVKLGVSLPGSPGAWATPEARQHPPHQRWQQSSGATRVRSTSASNGSWERIRRPS